MDRARLQRKESSEGSKDVVGQCGEVVVLCQIGKEWLYGARKAVESAY
jgi:hypothetical protein